MCIFVKCCQNRFVVNLGVGQQLCCGKWRCPKFQVRVGNSENGQAVGNFLNLYFIHISLTPPKALIKLIIEETNCDITHTQPLGCYVITLLLHFTVYLVGVE